MVLCSFSRKCLFCHHEALCGPLLHFLPVSSPYFKDILHLFSWLCVSIQTLDIYLLHTSVNVDRTLILTFVCTNEHVVVVQFTLTIIKQSAVWEDTHNPCLIRPL